MIRKNILRLIFIVLAGLMVSSLDLGLAANNIVPVTHLTDQSRTVTANHLKPPDCAAITVTAIVYCPPGGGNCDGSNANELILGSPNVDIIQGKGGSDCIVGGGGDDDISGSQARDVCIGGPGLDILKKCETVIQ